METALIAPSAELVRAACEEFNRDNLTEKALADLFGAYPTNEDAGHVLLKVAALNSLYATRILAVLKMAEHIAGLGVELDAAMAAGSPDAVEQIAKISIGEKDFTFYSFASKYCNWHRPELYPIYDSRVDKYLWLLKKQGAFDSGIFVHRQDLWNYPKFRDIMTALRDQFGLGSFSFKQIDAFLWSQGEAIWAAAEEDETAAASKPIAAPDDAVATADQGSAITETAALSGPSAGDSN